MVRSILAVCAIAVASSQPALAAPGAYDTPEAAVEAVIAALDARDRAALVAVFGPESEDVILSDDPEENRETWGEFLSAYNEMHRVVIDEAGDVAVLYIGTEQWPFPAPLDRGEDGKWRFDAEEARDEVLTRRIGENELDVIELLRAYHRIQAAYRQVDYDGDGVMEFASAILSDEGERNGLYWVSEPGAPESPIGDFVARASADGYSLGGDVSAPEPFSGYYFRILDGQGENAPGGAYGYVVGGNMVAGHAMIAFPSAYGETGIMSFLVGENGVVFDADLGEETLTTAAGITTYDPDERWAPVE